MEDLYSESTALPHEGCSLLDKSKKTQARSAQMQFNVEAVETTTSEKNQQEIDIATIGTATPSSKCQLYSESPSPQLNLEDQKAEGSGHSIVNKLSAELQRLQKFLVTGKTLLNQYSDELCRQIIEDSRNCEMALEGQVEAVCRKLEGAISSLSGSETGSNKLADQLKNLSSSEAFDKAELLQLGFTIAPCSVASAVSNSTVFFAKVIDDFGLKATNLPSTQLIAKTTRIEPEDQLLDFGEVLEEEAFDLSKIKLELSKIEEPHYSKTTAPTSESPSKSRIKQLESNPSHNKSEKKANVVGQINTNSKKTLYKQITLIDKAKPSDAQPTKIRANTIAETESKAGPSRISKPTLTRKLSTDLDLSFSGTSTASKLDAKHLGAELKVAKGATTSRIKPDITRNRASTTLQRPSLDLTKSDKTSADNSYVIDALTDRPSKSRSTALKKEEFKTTKPKPVHRQSLQLRPTDLPLKHLGARSPTKEPRNSCTPRTPASPNLYQLMHYFIPSTHKVISLEIETETVYTAELDIPQAFCERSAWCETQTQELLYTGGFADAPLNNVWLVSPQRKTYMEVTPMLTPRHSHQLCALNDMIFAIGGTGTEPLTDCEVFSIGNCLWKKAPSLNFARTQAAACVHNGRIYVAGGYDQDSIETYDPIEEHFSLLFLVLPMAGMCSMTSYNEDLIILQNERVLELELASLTIKELCSWKLSPCWSPASITFRDGCVYMTLEGEFTRFNIRTQTVEKL